MLRDSLIDSWNRRVLGCLAIGFLLMSAAVYLDQGVGGSLRRLDDLERHGRALWHAEGCGVCHQLYGMGGFQGPDLTNVIRRAGREATAWVIRNGRGGMPALGLEESEIAALVAFLAAVDETGTAPTRTWPPQGFPNATQPEIP